MIEKLRPLLFSGELATVHSAMSLNLAVRPFNTHCVISLLIPLEEDVCEFLIFSYSFKGQQLLLK